MVAQTEFGSSLSFVSVLLVACNSASCIGTRRVMASTWEGIQSFQKALPFLGWVLGAYLIEVVTLFTDIPPRYIPWYMPLVYAIGSLE